MIQNGTVGDHGRQHTCQSEILGPFYLPANILGGILSLIIKQNWHEFNFMELGPLDEPPHPWSWP